METKNNAKKNLKERIIEKWELLRSEVSWQGIKRNIYYKLIYPFKASNAPIHDVSLGAAIGMFWAMTPTFGVQIPILTFTWVVLRFFKIHFYMPVAFALLWTTNVFTVPFFYYLFFLIGKSICFTSSCRNSSADVETFESMITVPDDLGWWEGVILVTYRLYENYGYPLFVGGFLFATVTALLSYPVTLYMVTEHRKKLAKEKGITLEEWERRVQHKD